MKQSSAEWLRMAAIEPYRIGARLGVNGMIRYWMVYDCREEPRQPIARRETRAEAVALADQMNAEHRRWFS